MIRGRRQLLEAFLTEKAAGKKKEAFQEYAFEFCRLCHFLALYSFRKNYRKQRWKKSNPWDRILPLTRSSFMQKYRKKRGGEYLEGIEGLQGSRWCGNESIGWKRNPFLWPEILISIPWQLGEVLFENTKLPAEKNKEQAIPQQQCSLNWLFRNSPCIKCIGRNTNLWES